MSPAVRTPLALVLLALGLCACQGSDVGAPCIPEQVPENGFVFGETYLETSSPQCETRLCVVRNLEGDPSTTCTGTTCSTPEEVAANVYCTCRCGETGCVCPDGFACEDTGGLGTICVRAP